MQKLFIDSSTSEALTTPCDVLYTVAKLQGSLFTAVKAWHMGHTPLVLSACIGNIANYMIVNLICISLTASARDCSPILCTNQVLKYLLSLDGSDEV